jgi:hypothetical protein
MVAYLVGVPGGVFGEAALQEEALNARKLPEYGWFGATG